MDECFLMCINWICYSEHSRSLCSSRERMTSSDILGNNICIRRHAKFLFDYVMFATLEQSTIRYTVSVSLYYKIYFHGLQLHSLVLGHSWPEFIDAQ